MNTYLLDVDKGVTHSIWYVITGIFSWMKNGFFKGIWADKIGTFTGTVMIITILKTVNELIKTVDILENSKTVSKWYQKIFHGLIKVFYWIFLKTGVVWLVNFLRDAWHFIRDQRIIAEQRIMFQTEMLQFKENQEAYQAEMLFWKEEQKEQTAMVTAKIDNQAEQLAAAIDVIHVNTSKIIKIEHEIEHNSGGSLKDQISMSAKIIFEVNETVNKMYSNLHEVAAQAEIDFDLKDEAMFVIDKDGLMVKANKKYLKLMGVPRVDLVLGDNWKYTIIPKENLEAAEINSREWLKDPKEFCEPYEYADYTTKKKMTYMVQAKPLRSPEGEIIRTIGYVSELKQ